ncbi:hypothetical protein BsWGS_10663 [Bradybaena similaris]
MASVSIQELSDELDIFGAEIEEDQLLKLQSLCSSYCVDANSMVNQWMAFSTSRKMELNMDNLHIFDREWLPKKLQSSLSKTPQQKRVKVFNKDTIDSVLEDQIEILGSYATPDAKNQIAKRQLTPENMNNSKRFVGSTRSPSVNATFSPVVASPTSLTPSAKFSSRSNAGDIVVKFGNTNGISWKGEGLGCKVTHFDPKAVMTCQTKYMFQKMSEKAYVLNEAIQDMSAILQNAHGLEEFSHVALPSQESVTVAGRVCCDSVGRLNSQSVQLEGSRETSAGKCISLDLTDLHNYSLFPGQIIACDGVNTTGKKFAVKNIYQSVPLPFPEVTDEQENAGLLRMVVAVGPYSPSDCLDYSPLFDLVKYISRDTPDLCILMGPFVDTKNAVVNAGEIEESYEELFIKQMNEIGQATQNLGCKVVIVSASRDVHMCHSVYPQPPFHISNHNSDGSERLNAEKELTKHLMFVSDPSTLLVNGLVVGLTSTDILMHLTKSEISAGLQGGLDRLGRLAQHIIHQHSYYPLYPPADDINVDYELWETHARLPVTPHVLILPSDHKAFVKDIGGCCCVNPGRLTTGVVGGTYAHMVIDTKLLAASSNSPASACAAHIIKV